MDGKRIKEENMSDIEMQSLDDFNDNSKGSRFVEFMQNLKFLLLVECTRIQSTCM